MASSHAAVARARAGGGPALIEGRTYRYYDHSLGLGRIVRAPYREDEEVVSLTGVRRANASRMMQSFQTMAQVTLTTEADLTSAMTLRAGLARQWDGLSPLAMVIRATARAPKDHPRLNAVQEGDQYRAMPNIDIGIAVSLDEGLITPVLRGADGKGPEQIASESRELSSMVREGRRARPEDVTGGTFTITNLGAQGVDGFTPIINPPQVAILGVGRVVEKARDSRWGDYQRLDDVPEPDL